MALPRAKNKKMTTTEKTGKLELKFFLNDAEVNMVRKERALQWGSIEIIKEAGKVVRIVTHESELI